jgi:hypothetical protein
VGTVATLAAGSALLTAGQLASMWAVAHRNRWGWALRTATNAAAVPYDIVTHQFAFVIAAGAGIVIAWRAFRRWGAKPVSAGR